ncbi:C40 family peptidase [Gordonia sp. TBRC 11910]|uniref:C40 family peptidase n=1 Tax=Gordonia asplenii TaxID=2725283 RepID=A0A848L2Q5_9ACTN|nr:C40 family peptidase [Gordonia asplenii]NMO03355.1 C40 family peptidase [Gordonia asplenii]
MAKHRLEQPGRGAKVAKGAVIAGSIAVGSLAASAGSALAAPAPTNTIDFPALGKALLTPNAKHDAAKKAPGSAEVAIPGIGSINVPGLSQNQIPAQFRPGAQIAPFLRQDTGVRALAAAESKIGSPYVYGAAGPNAFDCSGLVYYSYKQAGKTIPRDSYGQLGGGRPVAYKDAKPGDVLIFNGGSHAGIYAGNGMFVHSSTEGVPVRKAVVKEWALTGVRRY